MDREQQRRDRMVGTAAAALIVLLTAAMWIYVGRPLIRFIGDPEVFRDWVDSHGAFGRLGFVLMVVFQVMIAVIPGEPFELAAGYAFGALEGTALCLTAAFAGSLAVFLLVRRYGMRLVRLFFSEEKIDSLKFIKNSRKRDMLFLLVFMIPGTPKDLLSYFAGLTDMRLRTWIVISSLGRIPSILTSTIGGDALGDSRYGLAAAVLSAALILSAAGYLFYGRMGKGGGPADPK